ncbi:hypothetical protein GOP47_0014486 [Adiantum capillus-veneris]|uniref:UDP-N-acetylmuramoyl-L-alanine--D-glutamate ligase n=1 Tax=Adiantum capillus-veneris TaxID=13818 RepID=A0A9D4UMQ3_ADICA|nr:hypothetical protein GOP47_0014486 [Adiantum capillus-veneris]
MELGCSRAFSSALVAERPRLGNTNCQSFTLVSAQVGPLQIDAEKDLEGQVVTVLGLGVSGRAAVKLALARGAHVVAIDKNKHIPALQQDPLFSSEANTRLILELGLFNEEHLHEAHKIVVSPGISLEQYGLENLMQLGYPIVSELDFASEKLPKGVRIIAVTGTNGKSTVTSFTGQILEHAGIPCFTGGNLGVPLSDAALTCMECGNGGAPFQASVVEVSSYQMEIHAKTFRPSVAVVLNLTPDHLERHKTLERYGLCKCRLFTHMDPSQLAVIPAGDSLLQGLAAQSGGAGTRAWLGDLPGVQLNAAGSAAHLHVPTTSLEAHLDLTTLKATGVHNAHNAGTASLLALGVDFGLDEGAIQSALPTLKCLPHRMQQVCRDDNDVVWINDSKATNVDATYTGLKGLTKQQCVVLLGGLAKVLDEKGNIGFDNLVHVLNLHRAVVTFGASGEQIKKDLEANGLAIPCKQSKGLVEAVRVARGIAQPGDAVVLSPGCASFDEFLNFELRGQVFSGLARSIS